MTFWPRKSASLTVLPLWSGRENAGAEMPASRRRCDTGSGLPEGQVGRGLGTQIVRTLIQGELSGTIDWHTVVGSGTEVTIEIPLRWISEAK